MTNTQTIIAALGRLSDKELATVLLAIIEPTSINYSDAFADAIGDMMLKNDLSALAAIADPEHGDDTAQDSDEFKLRRDDDVMRRAAA